MSVPRGGRTSRPKARILGPGKMVTLENRSTRFRCRAEVLCRSGRKVTVTPIARAEVNPSWKRGSEVQVRVARPFGLFRYKAKILSTGHRGQIELQLSPEPAKRKQLREYFRLPVRMSVRARNGGGKGASVIVRALDLSAGGVLLHDPDHQLSTNGAVYLGLPVCRSGELLRVKGRVIRKRDGDGRLALSFDGITEAGRQTILRYLFREHRRRSRGTPPGRQTHARISMIHESP